MSLTLIGSGGQHIALSKNSKCRQQEFQESRATVSHCSAVAKCDNVKRRWTCENMSTTGACENCPGVMAAAERLMCCRARGSPHRARSGACCDPDHWLRLHRGKKIPIAAVVVIHSGSQGGR
eukprot:8343862-Pyramimonas_sp.AAC.1